MILDVERACGVGKTVDAARVATRRRASSSRARSKDMSAVPLVALAGLHFPLRFRPPVGLLRPTDIVAFLDPTLGIATDVAGVTRGLDELRFAAAGRFAAFFAAFFFAAMIGSLF